MEGKTILIVEDEPTIKNVVKKYFEAKGFSVISADNGFTALEAFNSNNIDLVCLDVMMPHIDGWTVTEAIRENSEVPIIIMTALSSEENILKGYSLKIDDYVTKPFNPKILVAKAISLLNRISNPVKKPRLENLLCAGPIEISLDSKTMKVDDVQIEMSNTEYELICYLVKNKNFECTRDDIFKNVWKKSNVDPRIVDAYIKKIRKLLGPYSGMIKTVFKSGYLFEVNHEKV